MGNICLHSQAKSFDLSLSLVLNKDTEIRAKKNLQLVLNIAAKQVACFLLPVFPYLKKLLYLFKVVLSTSKHLEASFQGSKRTDVPHTNCTTQKK